jgi:hypothetical protein
MSGGSIVKRLVAGVVGVLGLTSFDAWAVSAPGVRDEAVFSRELSGARRAATAMESMAGWSPTGAPAWPMAWPSATSTVSSSWSSVVSVPGGGQPVWATTPWPAAPAAVGWSFTDFMSQTNSWFGAGVPALPTIAVQPTGPFYYQQTFSFLFGTAYSAPMIARPGDGSITQTFFRVESVTFNYNPNVQGPQLPPTVAAIPEGDGLALLLAGLGVVGIARCRVARSRRARHRAHHHPLFITSAGIEPGRHGLSA